MYKIFVGAGYVGMGNAMLFAQANHKVIVADINESIVSKINMKIPHLEDTLLENYYNKNLNVTAMSPIAVEPYVPDTDVVFICTPTNYDETNKKFDTQSIERTIETFVSFGYKGLFIIKSTIPIGYTKKIEKQYKINIAFMPEFLREGTAIVDALQPDRIVIGANKTETTLQVQNLFGMIYDYTFTPMYVMSTDEAESVKLFANAYLAMRVAFFNELDNFAMANNLQARNIVTGVSADKRIGNTYNNPSFGYGGYCFPKDTKQLRSHYKNVPNNIIKAIVDSNKTRKMYIAKKIIETPGQMVGFYRLLAKTGSMNFRESAVLDIIEEVRKHKDVIIYEPYFN
jgi:UDPglucose 6-dehydrogenase